MKGNLKYHIPIIMMVGLVAALIGFGVAYAALVQWSKEVPATVVSAPFEILPENAMGIYFDEGCTKPVSKLNFKLPKWQPPLDKFLSWDRIPVFIKNNSNYTLGLVEPRWQSVYAMVDGERKIVGDVDWDLNWKEIEGIVKPGKVLPSLIELDLKPEAPEELSFTVVFGAAGSTEGEIPPELLRAPAKKG